MFYSSKRLFKVLSWYCCASYSVDRSSPGLRLSSTIAEFFASAGSVHALPRLVPLGSKRPLIIGGLLASEDGTYPVSQRDCRAGRLRAVIAVVAVSVFALTPAIASYDVDSDTIGIGVQKNTVSQDDKAEPSERIETSSANTSSASSSAARSITVKDPDPVIVLSGYDVTNENTVAAAPCAGHDGPASYRASHSSRRKRRVDSRIASAYSYADNDDGKGNFGTDATASGVPLTWDGLTVAVPESQSHLLGHPVAIRYGETIIVATVTDTGGFAGYGRAIDLAPGCWRLFGVSDVHDWGVRDVYYKFL